MLNGNHRWSWDGLQLASDICLSKSEACRFYPENQSGDILFVSQMGVFFYVLFSGDESWGRPPGTGAHQTETGAWTWIWDLGMKMSDINIQRNRTDVCLYPKPTHGSLLKHILDRKWGLSSWYWHSCPPTLWGVYECIAWLMPACWSCLQGFAGCPVF